MKNSMHWFAFLAACLTLPTAAENALAPANSASESKARDYVRYIGDDKRGKLETVIVTFKKGDVTLELVGAVHVADAAYYKELTRLFTGYEELLFELVDGQRLKQEFEGAPAGPPKKKKNTPAAKPDENPGSTGSKSDAKPAANEAVEASPAIKLIGTMIHGVGNYFQFQYQTEGIDYHTKNFVHADVSMDEFLRMQDDKGESFLGLFQKAIRAQFEIGQNREAEPKGGQFLLALLGDSSGLKVAMARQLAIADDLVNAMEHDGGSVIISDRNKKALEVLDREVAAGRKKLGLFYGAAHLGDMESRLEKRGYKRTGERWITAWDIKPRVDTLAKPAAPAE